MWQFLFPCSMWVRTTRSTLCSPGMEGGLKVTHPLKQLTESHPLHWVCSLALYKGKIPTNSLLVSTSWEEGVGFVFLHVWIMLPFPGSRRLSILDTNYRAVGRPVSSRQMAKHPRIYSETGSSKPPLIHVASKRRGVQCCPSYGPSYGVPGQGQTFSKALLLPIALPALPGIELRLISKTEVQTRVLSWLRPQIPHPLLEGFSFQTWPSFMRPWIVAKGNLKRGMANCPKSPGVQVRSESQFFPTYSRNVEDSGRDHSYTDIRCYL